MYTAFFTLLASNVVVIVPAGLWWRTRGTLSTADLLFFLVVGLGYTASVMKLMQLTVQLGRLGLGAAAITELDAAPVLPQPQAPAVLGEPPAPVLPPRHGAGESVQIVSAEPVGVADQPEPGSAQCGSMSCRCCQQTCATSWIGDPGGCHRPAGRIRDRRQRVGGRPASGGTGPLRRRATRCR
jgi:hypothetical protein